MSRYVLTLVLLAFTLIAVPELSSRFRSITALTGGSAEAQSTCTPPLYQGYPSGCSAINLRWLNQDPISLIDHYDIIRGGVIIGTAPGSAISYTDPVGCGFGGSYTIKQVMKSGASCSTTTTGNLPHTKPCDMCTGGGTPLNLVSSASFNSPVAPDSIATLFAPQGASLTSVTTEAFSLPLPTNLQNTQVLVNGTPSQLFYVSPNQINFIMPPSGFGAVNVVVTGSNGERTEGVSVTAPAPAIFSANSSGGGFAAAVVTADGKTYQRIFDSFGNGVPVNPGSNVLPTYLILFGTGLRNQRTIQVKVGGQDCQVMWAGAHPQLPGVDQINAKLPPSLGGVGEVLITVTADGFLANFTRIRIGK